MLRIITITLALASFTTAVQSDVPVTPPAEVIEIASIHRAPQAENHTLTALKLHLLPAGNAVGCCKVCTAGKACGNSCISKYDICHVGPGCACDG
jgi:hypothetical protein